MLFALINRRTYHHSEKMVILLLASKTSISKHTKLLADDELLITKYSQISSNISMDYKKIRDRP